MSSKSYYVAMDENDSPRIYKIDQTTPEEIRDLSWGEAKKELRKWYLDTAKSLRGVTEKTYFQNV